MNILFIIFSFAFLACSSETSNDSSLSISSNEDLDNENANEEQKLLDEEKKKEEQEKRDYSELMNPKKKIETKSELPYKKLEDVMKVELMEGKTVEEIKAIWIEYHVLKDSIAAVIPSEVFDCSFPAVQAWPLAHAPLDASRVPPGRYSPKQ